MVVPAVAEVVVVSVIGWLALSAPEGVASGVAAVGFAVSGNLLSMLEEEDMICGVMTS